MANCLSTSSSLKLFQKSTLLKWLKELTVCWSKVMIFQKTWKGQVRFWEKQHSRCLLWENQNLKRVSNSNSPKMLLWALSVMEGLEYKTFIKPALLHIASHTCPSSTCMRVSDLLKASRTHQRTILKIFLLHISATNRAGGLEASPGRVRDLE